jgi:hypothetical protein
MKIHLLKQFVLFSLLIFMVYCMSITVISKYGPGFLKKNLRYERGAYGHMYTRLAEVDTIADIDVLILGSSHAYRGFDTRFFAERKLRAFNLGSSAQTPMQGRYLLTKYVERLKPEIVVWEVFPNTFTSDGYESMVDLASNKRYPYDLLSMTLEINQIPAYNTYIISCMRSLLSMDDNYRERAKLGADQYIHGGYVETNKTAGHAKSKLNPVNRVFNTDQKKSFEEALRYLDSRGISVMLVQAPYTKQFGRNILNASEIDSYFNQVVEIGLAESYRNFNQYPLPLNDSTDFYDLHHLNSKGVAKFNIAFLELFLSSGITVNNQ